jgi:hypothetical protein
MAYVFEVPTGYWTVPKDSLRTDAI